MSLIAVAAGSLMMIVLMGVGQFIAARKRSRYYIWAFALPAVIFLALSYPLSRAMGAQTTTGWGLRATSQKAGPDDRQVLTLWDVQTPSGMYVCVTANYGAGDSSNRPLAITCDWGTK